MKLMSVVLLVYFFVGSIMPGGDWHEVPKIINLIEHFKMHENQSQGEISVVDFLNMHYSDSETQDNDEHANLPFNHLCSFTFIALVPVFEFEISCSIPQSKAIELYSFSVVRDHIPNVWQPPRA